MKTIEPHIGHTPYTTQLYIIIIPNTRIDNLIQNAFTYFKLLYSEYRSTFDNTVSLESP